MCFVLVIYSIIDAFRLWLIVFAAICYMVTVVKNYLTYLNQLAGMKDFHLLGDIAIKY